MKILLSHLIIKNIKAEAKVKNNAFTQKKFDLSTYPSHILLKTPDNLFPIEVAKNHPPIIRAVILGGLNLLTNDKPIGLRKSSPTVITAYDEINHQALALNVPFSVACTAHTITIHERAEINNPIAILAGVDGSFPTISQKSKECQYQRSKCNYPKRIN